MDENTHLETVSPPRPGWERDALDFLYRFVVFFSSLELRLESIQEMYFTRKEIVFLEKRRSISVKSGSEMGRLLAP
jgi:hypothetical protein